MMKHRLLKGQLIVSKKEGEVVYQVFNIPNNTEILVTH